MNNNKMTINKKMIFTVSGIVVLCIAILAGTYLLQREPDAAFEPLSTEAGTSTNTWDENADAVTEVPESNTKDTQRQGEVSDQTQTIVNENEAASTANLSDSKTKDEAASNQPQEKPVTTDDTTNPEKQPDCDSSTQPPEASISPADDSTNSTPVDTNNSDHSGKVYDPVFGWIDTGDTNQDNVDSDGDINKQIGTMGN